MISFVASALATLVAHLLGFAPGFFFQRKKAGAICLLWRKHPSAPGLTTKTMSNSLYMFPTYNHSICLFLFIAKLTMFSHQSTTVIALCCAFLQEEETCDTFVLLLILIHTDQCPFTFPIQRPFLAEQSQQTDNKKLLLSNACRDSICLHEKDVVFVYWFI